MQQLMVKKDIVVIGGGLAGICAAISAARLGKAVALVQNRSVLGGNSSSEIRVWVSSATKHGVNRYARETGIMGELFLENQYRNMDGNPYIWDALLLEKVKLEPAIQLFLETEVHEVQCDAGKITSVKGWTQGSEKATTFTGEAYIDCTGDGLIGYLAGAEYMLGREAKETYGESLAPAVADQELMGSTLLFYTKDNGHATPFVAPAFAKNIADTSILKNRVIQSGDSGARYWWIEWGGELDIVHDNDHIRDELLAIIYGIWDYIKNSGKFAAENLTLEWVGTVPGKREYRRLLGDYVLTQQDIETQQEFEDTIAFGGWSIDLHPSKGIYNEEGGAHHAVADGIYPLPYRMLYSKSIDNLFMAGRNVSASHVAFGGIRIMGTCALLGEAAGTAASLAVDYHCSPAVIYEDHRQTLQQLLLKNDASLIGVANQDKQDCVAGAKLSASSYLREINTYGRHMVPYLLERDAAISFPVNPYLKGLELLVNASLDTTLMVELWETGKPQNYIPHKKVAEKQVSVSKGQGVWQGVPLEWYPENPQNAFVIVKANKQLELYVHKGKFPGVLSYEFDVIEEMNQPKLHHFTRDSSILYWTTQKISNHNFVFKVNSESLAYHHDQVVNGFVRPYGGPNVWSTRFAASSEWLQVDFPSKRSLAEVRMTFDDDVNEDLINLHHHYTPHASMPELIKNYRILYLSNGQWQEAKAVTDNRIRHQRLQFEPPIETEALRVEFMDTNGSEFMSVYEIRAYEEEQR